MNGHPEGKRRGFLPAVVVCLTLFALLFSTLSISSSVPVIPNKAVVVGTVMEYAIGSSSLYSMSPEQTIYKLTIIVEGSENIETFTNFLEGKEGQTLPFFTKEKPSSEVYGKKIKALIKYSADERGGRFWIDKNIEILK